MPFGTFLIWRNTGKDIRNSFFCLEWHLDLLCGAESDGQTTYIQQFCICFCNQIFHSSVSLLFLVHFAVHVEPTCQQTLCLVYKVIYIRIKNW